MIVYRVLPWLSGARSGTPGHPLFLPPLQGAGRIDNPDAYRTLYVSDTAAGAIGEAFGNHAIWTEELLAAPPAIPGARPALTRYELSANVLDLDAGLALHERALRPSDIATRRRATTQRWALAIFEQGGVDGVRWWSYWEASWGAIGLWRHEKVELLDCEPLHRGHPAVLDAAETLARPWRQPRVGRLRPL